MLCCFDPPPPPGARPQENHGQQQQSMTNNDPDLVAVAVPPGASPGQTLAVKHPHDASRMTTASIPAGFQVGQVFHVRFPAAATLQPYVTVPGVAVAPQQQQQQQQFSGGPQQVDDFALGFGNSPSNNAPRQQQQAPEFKKSKLCSPEMILLNTKGIVNVKVPSSLKAGDRMRVRIPDGRYVDAVIPPGNVSEFQLKVPTKKQNFHDNPIAVHAPMALGPMMMM